MPHLCKLNEGALPQIITILLAMAVIVTLGLALYGATGRDDVHITYWAAEALAKEGEIRNYNGNRLEQSSALLHTIMLALAIRVTALDPTTLGPLLSISGACFTVLLSFIYAQQTVVSRAWFAPILTSLLCYLVYWAPSGMETTWTSALTLATICSGLSWIRHRTWVTLFALIACSVALAASRPEAGLVAVFSSALFFIVWLLRFRRPEDGVLPPVAILGTATCGLLGVVSVRMAYFGELFPAPVTAKVDSIGLGRLFRGARYLADELWLPSLIALLAMAVLALLECWRRAGGRYCASHNLGAAYAIGFLLFTFSSGGDWMEAGRFIVPMLPIVTVLAWAWLERRNGRRWIMATLLVLLMLGDLGAFAFRTSKGTPSFTAKKVFEPALRSFHLERDYSWWEKANRTHLRDIPVIENAARIIASREANGRPLVVWSHQAGMVFYHLARRSKSRIEFVDLAGLSTQHIRDCADHLGRQGEAVGVRAEYSELMPHFKDLNSKCGLPAPDLIIDTFWTPTPEDWLEPIRRAGYTIVYRQRGRIDAVPQGYGTAVDAGSFIAVRKGAVVAPDAPWRTDFEWPRN